jgi:hypothetical protein
MMRNVSICRGSCVTVEIFFEKQSGAYRFEQVRFTTPLHLTVSCRYAFNAGINFAFM